MKPSQHFLSRYLVLAPMLYALSACGFSPGRGTASLAASASNTFSTSSLLKLIEGHASKSATELKGAAHGLTAYYSKLLASTTDEALVLDGKAVSGIHSALMQLGPKVQALAAKDASLGDLVTDLQIDQAQALNQAVVQTMLKDMMASFAALPKTTTANGTQGAAGLANLLGLDLIRAVSLIDAQTGLDLIGCLGFGCPSAAQNPPQQQPPPANPSYPMPETIYDFPTGTPFPHHMTTPFGAPAQQKKGFTKPKKKQDPPLFAGYFSS